MQLSMNIITKMVNIFTYICWSVKGDAHLIEEVVAFPHLYGKSKRLPEIG